MSFFVNDRRDNKANRLDIVKQYLKRLLMRKCGQQQAVKTALKEKFQFFTPKVQDVRVLAKHLLEGIESNINISSHLTKREISTLRKVSLGNIEEALSVWERDDEKYRESDKNDGNSKDFIKKISRDFLDFRNDFKEHIVDFGYCLNVGEKILDNHLVKYVSDIDSFKNINDGCELLEYFSKLEFNQMIELYGGVGKLYIVTSRIHSHLSILLYPKVAKEIVRIFQNVEFSREATSSTKGYTELTVQQMLKILSMEPSQEQIYSAINKLEKMGIFEDI